MRHLILLTAAMAQPLSSQEIQFPASLDKLAEKAQEVVNVSLDPTSLGLARRALSAEKSEEVKAKQFVEGLKGIYVRSFKFASPGGGSTATKTSRQSASHWRRPDGRRSSASGARRRTATTPRSG